MIIWQSHATPCHVINNCRLTADMTKFILLNNSMHIFFRWCHCHSIDREQQLIWEIAVLLDHILPKNVLQLLANQMLVKQLFFYQPLMEICRYVGHVNNVNIASMFAWQKCINEHLISIEEVHILIVSTRLMMLIGSFIWTSHWRILAVYANSFSKLLRENE